MMNKGFYVSGFLFHPHTEQILLQQTSQSSQWSLLGGESPDEQAGEKVFRQLISALLKVKLDLQAIMQVYSYFHKDLKKTHSIFYGRVEETKDFKPSKGTTFTWFSRRQIIKLPLDEQTKQDIIIGQRVIDSHERKRLGEPNLE